MPWLLYQSQGRSTVVGRQPHLRFPGLECLVLSRSISVAHLYHLPCWVVLISRLTGQLIKAMGNFLACVVFPVCCPSLLQMNGNFYLKPMSSLHLLLHSTIPSLSHLYFLKHLDAGCFARHSQPWNERDGGVLSLGSADILGWIIVVGRGCPVH